MLANIATSGCARVAGLHAVCQNSGGRQAMQALGMMHPYQLRNAPGQHCQRRQPCTAVCGRPLCHPRGYYGSISDLKPLRIWRVAAGNAGNGTQSSSTVSSNGYDETHAGRAVTFTSTELMNSDLPSQRADVIAQQQPLILELLHLLTDKRELLCLQSPGASPGDTPQTKIQKSVNDVAYKMSSHHLSQPEATPAEAIDMLLEAAKKLSAADKPKLFTTPTTTPSHPALVPVLYYAVAAGDCRLVDQLLDFGASPNPDVSKSETITFQHVPVLALAITKEDHEMVRLLLQRGASPAAIPTDIYVRALKEEGYHGVQRADQISDVSHSAWCQATEDRSLLQDKLNLDVNAGLQMAYWLGRALKGLQLTKFAGNVLTAAKLCRAPELRMAVHGQEIACALLYNNIVTHFGMSDKLKDQRRPLVLLLAGPSGHGKTLFSRKLQTIFPNMVYHYQDCSKVHNPYQLWGAAGCYKNSENRPPFAKHLYANDGKRSVVILDEIEKMKHVVLESLLSLLQDGWLNDEYSGAALDCTQTIFLLTTNAADSDIKDHWKGHSRQLMDLSLQPAVLHRKLKPLDEKIRTALILAINSLPFVGRVHGVVPFFPMTEFEQKVLTNSCLLDLKAGLARPPNTADGRVHGNIKVDLQDQRKVCGNLAHRTYNDSEGVRAIKRGVEAGVGDTIKTDVLQGRLPGVGGVATVCGAENEDEDFEVSYL